MSPRELAERERKKYMQKLEPGQGGNPIGGTMLNKSRQVGVEMATL